MAHRPAQFVALALGTIAVAVTTAKAQGPGGGPAIPVAVDLKKVAAGTWAAYSMTMGAMTVGNQRYALVEKSASTNTIEVTMVIR